MIESCIALIIGFDITFCWFFTTFYDGFKFFKRTTSKITKLLFRCFLRRIDYYKLKIQKTKKITTKETENESNKDKHTWHAVFANTKH